MKIIDAQVHLWANGNPSAHHRQVTAFLAEHLLREMDEAGVDGALIHPHLPWDPQANALAVDAARRYPQRFAVLGELPPDKPESRGKIAGWRQQSGMLGLRFALVQPHEKTWHEDGTMDWVWPAAAQAGLPVAILAWRFLPTVKAIAERHPNLRLLLDHCGLIRPAQDEAAFADLDQLLGLARLPNVAIKATGAPHYSTAPYPFRNIHDHLHRIYDAYGPQRFFWGTDLTRMPCSYRQCVTLFTEELPWLSGRDLELVMGRALCDWIGWNFPFDS